MTQTFRFASILLTAAILCTAATACQSITVNHQFADSQDVYLDADSVSDSEFEALKLRPDPSEAVVFHAGDRIPKRFVVVARLQAEGTNKLHGAGADWDDLHDSLADRGAAIGADAILLGAECVDRNTIYLTHTGQDGSSERVPASYQDYHCVRALALLWAEDGRPAVPREDREWLAEVPKGMKLRASED